MRSQPHLSIKLPNTFDWTFSLRILHAGGARFLSSNSCASRRLNPCSFESVRCQNREEAPETKLPIRARGCEVLLPPTRFRSDSVITTASCEFNSAHIPTRAPLCQGPPLPFETIELLVILWQHTTREEKLGLRPPKFRFAGMIS